MSEPTSCCRVGDAYCDRCDLLALLASMHVIGVKRDEDGGLVVTMESAPEVMGCRACGVVAHAHGRVKVDRVDAPAMGHPVRVRWRARRWVCPEPACPVSSFVEQDQDVAAPQGKLTVRACRWAIGQLRTEHASVNGIRGQLGCGWRTVWDGNRPMLQAADGEAHTVRQVVPSRRANPCTSPGPSLHPTRSL